MKKFYLSLLLAAPVFMGLQAQRTCGTMDVHEQHLANDPYYEQRRTDIENWVNQYLRDNPGADRVLVTIPVVVHVVYNTTAENVSDAQIQSQITVLNQDFRKLNSDVSLTPSVFQSLAADVNVEFCLASVDPNGNPTTGITRTSSTVTSFAANDNMKFTSSGGKDAWPASSYLNLWVCDLSSGLLGYAQFPGGAAATDGVVIDYQYFGTIGTATAPFNKGRTATHEVGHWLNLFHIWGDDGTGCTGSDQVSDTPNQGGSNGGCPTFPKISCSNGPNGDLFMNYMDYTDDACMYMFSNGQAARMQALLAPGGFRNSLLSSNGCGTPGTTCSIPGSRTTSAIGNTGATVSWAAAAGAVNYSLRYKLTSSGTWTTVAVSTTSYAITGLTACSNYEWQVQTNCASGNSGYSTSTTFSTTGCVATYCASQGNSTADEFIQSVAVTGFSNVSGNNGGYANYTGQTINVNKGSAYTFTGTPGFTGSAYSEFWRVWIDYNGDLDFLDAGEQVFGPTTGSTAVVSGSFTIPTTAITGTTRMRVAMKYGAAPTSCEAFTYGEVEDYTVNIQAAAASCNTVHEVNNTLATAAAIALNTNINSYICPSGDEDYFSFANTSSQKNIQVTLQSLPYDYDLYLYNPSGVLVAQSTNSGTTNELVKYNNGPVGTYKVRVIGYAGVFHGSDSYILKATRKATPYRTDGTESEPETEALVIVNAFPNPTHGRLDFVFQSDSEKLVVLTAYDLVGREVFRNTFVAVEGENISTVNIADMAAGMYVFMLSDNEIKTTIRVMKE